jgi:hypothetical protein
MMLDAELSLDSGDGTQSCSTSAIHASQLSVDSNPEVTSEAHGNDTATFIHAKSSGCCDDKVATLSARSSKETAASNAQCMGSDSTTWLERVGQPLNPELDFSQLVAEVAALKEGLAALSIASESRRYSAEPSGHAAENDLQMQLRLVRREFEQQLQLRLAAHSAEVMERLEREVRGLSERIASVDSTSLVAASAIEAVAKIIEETQRDQVACAQRLAGVELAAASLPDVDRQLQELAAELRTMPLYRWSCLAPVLEEATDVEDDGSPCRADCCASSRGSDPGEELCFADEVQCTVLRSQHPLHASLGRSHRCRFFHHYRQGAPMHADTLALTSSTLPLHVGDVDSAECGDIAGLSDASTKEDSAAGAAVISFEELTTL